MYLFVLYGTQIQYLLLKREKNLDVLLCSIFFKLGSVLISQMLSLDEKILYLNSVLNVNVLLIFITLL